LRRLQEDKRQKNTVQAYQLERDILVAMQRGVQQERWPLRHDFNKLYAEVLAADRFLAQLSPLLAMVARAVEQEIPNPWVEFNDGEPRVRAEVLHSLLRGAPVSEIGLDVLLRLDAFLVFDTVEIAFESPFAGRLWGYLKENYKKEITLGTVLSAVAIFESLAIAIAKPPPPPPIPPTPPQPQITIYVTIPSPQARFHGDETSVAFYTNRFSSPSIVDIQRGLKLLGFNPGRIDGVAGDHTVGAAKDLCHSAGLQFKGLYDRDFLNLLSIRLANRFP